MDWTEHAEASPTTVGPWRGDPDSAAYILYTSGSTGTPKGVVLSHRNGRSFVDWAAAHLGLSGSDRLSSHAPFHFDLSVLDLFGAAAAGAGLALVPRRALVFPTELVRWIRDSQVTVWYSVPSALVQLVERTSVTAQDLTSLRLILFAGEVFPARHLARLMRLAPEARYLNLYGPTETNVCMFHEVGDPPAADERVPIGRPLPQVEVRLASAQSDTARPEGVLEVRGSTVMSGYWRGASRPLTGLTPDGFYSTGDLVSVDSEGLYHFLGRRDSQVKVRGHRIELGDIEAAVMAHPLVEECAGVVTGQGPDAEVVVYLGAQSPPSERELRDHCSRFLPPYMVPGRFVTLEKLPRTSTGKVDRQMLAQSDQPPAD